MKSQSRNDIAEHVADNRAQEQQDGDDHDGHQHQDQGVLDQALALLTRKEQHFAVTSFPLRVTRLYSAYLVHLHSNIKQWARP